MPFGWFRRCCVYLVGDVSLVVDMGFGWEFDLIDRVGLTGDYLQ